MDVAKVARECALYRRLLELGREGEIGPLLDQSLALIVEFTGARIAYLELHHDDPTSQRFSRAFGCTDEDLVVIRAAISRGIIQAALAAGETVETPSAIDDPRFNSRGSVQQHEIDAVLCAPVGRPPIGVVYLQGRPDGTSFDSLHREGAELFASQLALIAERLRGPFVRNDSTDPTLEVRRRFRCNSIVGRSHALARILEEASVMAPVDVSMLITGPSGTGKSALARAVHDNSRRASGPFVAINCGAIPTALVESELFGTEKGAHSTATQRTVGKVAVARGGTLFLDEIGDLPYEAQTKLLQLLQDRQYYPLGSSQIVAADVRVIAATNFNLLDAVDKGTFRRDLLYRLNVVTIAMPGLAERREDLPLLVAHFSREACTRHGLPQLEVTRAAIALATDEAWPGQVRELANVVEAGAIRAVGEGSSLLHARHLFPSKSAELDPDHLEYREATRRFQRRYVLDVLGDTDWNIVDTTRVLGIARSHLYNLIAAFDLKRPKD